MPLLSREQYNDAGRPTPAVQLLPGAFLIGDAKPTRPEQLHAALMWGHPRSAIAGPSAAILWGLKGFDPGPVHLAVPDSPKDPPSSGLELILYRKRVLGPYDVQDFSGLRLTSVERTLFDVAGEVSWKKLEWLVDQALKMKLTSARKLHATFRRLQRRGRKGVAAMRELFDRRGYSLLHLRSTTEDDFAKLFVAQALPQPEYDFEVGGGREPTYFIDIAYPAQKLAIEVDTWAFHSDEESWAKDQSRLNKLVTWGWAVMRLTNHDLDRPREVARTVKAALRVRGWRPE